MDSEMKPRINAARHLADEIARISDVDQRRLSRRMSVEGAESPTESENEMQASQGRAVPVSPPNDVSGKLLKLIVVDAAAKTDVSNRLHELKTTLLDLCERQLNDLLDAAPAGPQQDIEDVDKLLAEMRSLRQGMETIVAIQGVIEEYGAVDR